MESLRIEVLDIIGLLINLSHDSVAVSSEINVIVLKAGFVPFFLLNSVVLHVSLEGRVDEPVSLQDSTAVGGITTEAAVVFLGVVEVSLSINNYVGARGACELVSGATISNQDNKYLLVFF